MLSDWTDWWCWRFDSWIGRAWRLGSLALQNIDWIDLTDRFGWSLIDSWLPICKMFGRTFVLEYMKSIFWIYQISVIWMWKFKPTGGSGDGHKVRVGFFTSSVAVAKIFKRLLIIINVWVFISQNSLVILYPVAAYYLLFLFQLVI